MNADNPEITPIITNLPDAPKPQIVIIFHAPGSAEFSLHAEGVSPAQMLGAAAWLDWYARRAFDATAQQQAQRGIIVPKGIIK